MHIHCSRKAEPSGDRPICYGFATRGDVVQKDRATLQRADKPGVATACRKNRAMPCGAEGLRDATTCRETARCHVVQRTARRYAVQRNRAMPRGAERQRDATRCR